MFDQAEETLKSHSENRLEPSWQQEFVSSIGKFCSNEIAQHGNLVVPAEIGGAILLAISARAGAIKMLNKFRPLVPEFKSFGTEIRVNEIPAFKVLTADGRAPWCRSEKWPLPTQNIDGSWSPGEWKIAIRSSSLQLLSRPWAPGLHVTNNPIEWQIMANSNFGKPTRIFKVEIGDADSIARWDSNGGGHNGMAAKVVRLVRPVTEDEFFQMNRTIRQKLGHE